ncbi:MAG: glycosyltransferase family 2 protein [Clostridia bacterium]|nr:glycosyltransferase family 2 protein [Clostridia bacterium]
MVSILLAAYNGQTHLSAQLASLQAQTMADFRVLWQDDGSQDDTPVLLTTVSAADSRFRPAAIQGQQLGAIGNFLSLMAQDDAPYTALCDQDDIWHDDKLARCMSAMQEAETQCGAETPLLVHHDVCVTDAGGALLHPSFFAHQGWDGGATALPPLLVQNNVTGCTCLMNAALRKLVVSHAQPNQLYMHDWFIALTAAAFGKIVFLDTQLADYRQHGTNVMGASRYGLLRRSLSALTAPARARERIRLTYRHTRMFRESYGSLLPGDARRTIDGYLSTEHQPKLRRISAVQQLGCTMQSPAARIGQIIFG